MIGAPGCDGWRALRARAMARRYGGGSMRSTKSLSQRRRRSLSTAVAAIARCASWLSVSANMLEIPPTSRVAKLKMDDWGVLR